MAHVCEVCSSKNKFNIIDGYYYCQECGTQSNQLIEMELERNPGEKLTGVTLKTDKKKPNETRITTWEEYNYILVGLVDEMIDLGANKNFKKTVLKLWTRYLQKIEAAFFTTEENILPKLPANYERRDAEIIYNKHHRKKRRLSFGSQNSRVSKTSSGKADSVIKSNNIYRILRKTKQELAKAQYESFKEEDSQSESSRSLSFSSTKTSDEENNLSMNLKFSNNARRLMKRKMSKKHITVHESDHEDSLDCHSDFHRSKSGDVMEMLSKKVLISIIYLALNLTNDEIQLADLIRFLREGHLSYLNIQRFLPENIEQDYKSNYEYMKKSVIWNHLSMRTMAAKLGRDISVTALNLPDIVNLANRYVDDLSLPNEMKRIVGKFIQFYQPKMPFDNFTTDLKQTPNYEGRAISYILFVLKLLFGLDGFREKEISKSVKKVNKFIEEKELKLFVFEDWLEYLNLRLVYLNKHHIPTSMLENTHTLKAPADHNKYLSYLKAKFESKVAQDRMTKGQHGAVNSVSKLLELLSNLSPTKDEDIDDNLIEFNSSLTPSRDYIKNILEKTQVNSKVSKILLQDFSKMNLNIFYKDKDSLGKYSDYFKDIHNLKLVINEISINYDKLQPVSIPIRENQIGLRLSWKYEVVFCAEREWQDLGPPTSRQYTAKEESRQKHLNKMRKYISKSKNSPQKEPKADELELKVTNCDYWLNFINSLTYQRLFIANDYDTLMESLPDSFQFLLKECARIVEQDCKYLLVELLAIEKTFVYTLNEEFDNIPKDRLDDKNVGSLFKYLW